MINGRSAFSKAVQCLDLHTGEMVCVKIIKNNKDFFDQSLDEVMLLDYLKQHDPDDSHHVVHIFDYFYHKEHLFIVCELLRDNLYELTKFCLDLRDIHKKQEQEQLIAAASAAGSHYFETASRRAEGRGRGRRCSGSRSSPALEQWVPPGS